MRGRERRRRCNAAGSACFEWDLGVRTGERDEQDAKSKENATQGVTHEVFKLRPEELNAKVVGMVVGLPDVLLLQYVLVGVLYYGWKR